MVQRNFWWQICIARGFFLPKNIYSGIGNSWEWSFGVFRNKWKYFTAVTQYSQLGLILKKFNWISKPNTSLSGIRSSDRTRPLGYLTNSMIDLNPHRLIIFPYSSKAEALPFAHTLCFYTVWQHKSMKACPWFWNALVDTYCTYEHHWRQLWQRDFEAYDHSLS